MPQKVRQEFCFWLQDAWSLQTRGLVHCSPQFGGRSRPLFQPIWGVTPAAMRSSGL